MSNLSKEKIEFPYCAKNCEVIKEFGVGECENVCPMKFKLPQQEMTVEEIDNFLFNWGVENKAFQKNKGFRRKLAQAIHDRIYNGGTIGGTTASP